MEEGQEDLKDELNLYKQEKEDLENVLDGFRKENTYLRAQIKMDSSLSTSMSTSLVEPATPFESKIHSLQDQVKKARSEQEKVEAENLHYQRRVGELEDELILCKNEVRETKTRVKERDISITELENELEGLRVECYSKSETIIGLQKHCQELQQMISAKSQPPSSAESSFSFYSDSNNSASTPESKLCIIIHYIPYTVYAIFIYFRIGLHTSYDTHNAGTWHIIHTYYYYVITCMCIDLIRFGSKRN